MHKISHRLFALGLSSAFAFFLNITIISLPLILVLAFYIGSFPDLDLKWGIQHRSFTHSLMFFIVMTIFCSLGTFYFYWFIQIMMPVPVFEINMSFINGFPIPSFFTYITSGNVINIIDDAFFKLFIYYFISFMSHFFLDMITPAGLSMGSMEVSGSIPSSNSFFNFFFSSVGLVTLLVTLAFYVIRSFDLLEMNYAIYFAIIGGLIFTVMISAILVQRHKNTNDIKCFHLDNDIDICLPEGKCFKFGSGKEDKVCNINEGEY